MALHLLIEQGGSKSLTVILNDGTPTAITDEHPGFQGILDALEAKASDDVLKGLLDPANAIYGKVNTLSERVRLVGGTLTFDGDPIDGPLADFIVLIAQKSDNTDSYAAWVKFMEKLATNPSAESRDHLFKFMIANGLTVDTEGDIVLYKGVRADGKSIHAGPGIVDGVQMNGNLPNEVGSVLEFARSKVDPNRGVACSTGLHAGTFEYASGFAQGRLLTVAINPRDVVSVPSDAHDAKVRVSRYRVVEVNEHASAYDTPVWGASDDEDDDEDYYDEDEADEAWDEFEDDDEDESDDTDEDTEDAPADAPATDDFERRVANFTARIPSIIQDEGWKGSLALYISKHVTAANRDAAREAIRRGGFR